MATQAGKRYFCDKCGSEFIKTRSGKGELKCGKKPMQQKKFRLAWEVGNV